MAVLGARIACAAPGPIKHRTGTEHARGGGRGQRRGRGSPETKKTTATRARRRAGWREPLAGGEEEEPHAREARSERPCGWSNAWSAML